MVWQRAPIPFTVRNFSFLPDVSQPPLAVMLGRQACWQAQGLTSAPWAAGSVAASVLADLVYFAMAFNLSRKGPGWAIFLNVKPFFANSLFRGHAWQVFSVTDRHNQRGFQA